MIFIKTNELSDVVFCHTDPFHETYGLGKTTEELREEGFLVDYLKELPQAEKRKGYRGITCFDANKFWFRYVLQELTPEEEYLEKMSILEEKQKQHEKILKEQQQHTIDSGNEVLELNHQLQSVYVHAGDAYNRAEMIAQEAAMMTMELMDKGEQIEVQKKDLLQTKKELEAERAKIEMQRQEAILMIQESAMMTMEMMNMNAELMQTKEELLEANQEAEKIKENILQANAEMVRTKEELMSAQETLMLTQFDVANLLLMMLDEGGTGQ